MCPAVRQAPRTLYIRQLRETAVTLSPSGQEHYQFPRGSAAESGGHLQRNRHLDHCKYHSLYFSGTSDFKLVKNHL